MAKPKNTLIGDTVGPLGPLYFYKKNGAQIVRERAESNYGPPTPAQALQRHVLPFQVYLATVLEDNFPGITWRPRPAWLSARAPLVFAPAGLTLTTSGNEIFPSPPGIEMRLNEYPPGAVSPEINIGIQEAYYNSAGGGNIELDLYSTAQRPPSRQNEKPYFLIFIRTHPGVYQVIKIESGQIWGWGVASAQIPAGIPALQFGVEAPAPIWETIVGFFYIIAGNGDEYGYLSGAKLLATN